MVFGITLLVNRNFNIDEFDGICIMAKYHPYHSDMADGEVKTGFNIPCGRGCDGAILFGNVTSNLVIALTPIVWYNHTVRTQERQDPNRQSKGRTVLSRAVAYLVSYLLTWG